MEKINETAADGNSVETDNETEPMHFEFTPVSIESFFDAEERGDADISPENIGLTVLSAHQEELVQKLRSKLKIVAPDRLERLDKRLKDLKTLATAIANFPSLLQRTNLNTSVRTPAALDAKAGA